MLSPCPVLQGNKQARDKLWSVSQFSHAPASGMDVEASLPAYINPTHSNLRKIFFTLAPSSRTQAKPSFPHLIAEPPALSLAVHAPPRAVELAGRSSASPPASPPDPRRRQREGHKLSCRSSIPCILTPASASCTVSVRTHLCLFPSVSQCRFFMVIVVSSHSDTLSTDQWSAAINLLLE
jgi:hypothetical protein